MKNIKFKLLIFLSLIFIITSCLKSELENTDTGLAPSNIHGKNLTFKNQGISGFSDNGTCIVAENNTASVTTTITKSPTYRYQKINSNTASLICTYSQHVDINTLSSSSFIEEDVTFNLTLTFTTEISGTYSGSRNYIKTSSSSEYLNSTFANETDVAFMLQ